MSQLGCTGSGNELWRQKKGPWSLGERKAKVTHLREGQRKGAGVLQKGKMHAGSSILRVSIPSLKMGLRGGLRGGSQWNFHQLLRCVLSESSSPLIGWHQGMGSLVIEACPDVSCGITVPGLTTFLGLS